MASTQKAWTFCSATGGFEKNLKQTSDFPQPPAPKKDQLLVEVTAMSVNQVDYKIPELGVLSKLMISVPAAPGLDFAGKITALGAGTEGEFRVGDRVFGRLNGPTKFGTMAQYTVAPIIGTTKIPEGVKDEEAAAATTTAMTAYQCIVPNVKAGDRVFINGGSGGTGTFGIQIAKAVGCSVTTSCSTTNKEMCKQLGADEIIDYRTQSVTEELKKKGLVYDLVVDNVGQPTDLYKSSTTFLKPSGKYVQIGADMSLSGFGSVASRMMVPSMFGGGQRKYQMLNVASKKEDFEQLAKWMGEGKVKSVVEDVLPFEKGPEGYAKLKAGGRKGNLVVKIE